MPVLCGKSCGAAQHAFVSHARVPMSGQVTRLYTDWLNCLFCCPCSKDQDPLPLLGLWSLGDDGQLIKAKGCWTKGQEAIAFRTYRVSSLHQGFVEV